MNEPALMHRDCVMCINEVENYDGNRVFRGLMVTMILDEIPVEQVKDDLCFKHRRIVEDDLRRAIEAKK